MGRDGTCGGVPNESVLLGTGGNGPGRNGTGGAPEWGPGEGMAGAGPRPDVGRGRGALSVGLLWVVGLGGGKRVVFYLFKRKKEKKDGLDLKKIFLIMQTVS